MDDFQMVYNEMVDDAVEASKAYYLGQPIMVDVEFDELVDAITRQESELLPEMIRADSPTQAVGSASLENVNQHAYPMLSLAKITEMDKAVTFAREISEELLAQKKLDGVSMSLEYLDGTLVRALTRGDGTRGEDVTEAMQLLPSIPSELAAEFTGFVRGEVVIHRDELPEGLKNARNGAAGSINHSDPKMAALRNCRFYAFDVLCPGLDDTGEALQAAGEMGFTLAPTMCCGPEDLEQVIPALFAAKTTLPYDTDGVVVKAAKYATRDKLGNRTNSPRWAFAYKVAGETAQARVTGLKHQVGKSGAIGLIYTIEPTALGGTTISNITAHNFSEIRRLDVRKGDVVTIRRAGDVIPYCERVTDPSARTGEEEKFEAPTACPGCSAPLETYGEKMQLRCTGTDCTPQLVRRLVHWSSRKAADIDGFSTDLIERLVEADRIGNVGNIYELVERDFTQIGRSSDFSKKIVAEIAKSREVGMRRALIGFSIPQASEGTAQRLAREYSRLEDVIGASVGELASIPDVGLVVASSVHDFFKSPEVQSVVDLLRNLGVNLDRLSEDAPLELSEASGGFSGEVVVITGKLSCERDEMKRLVEAAGGRVTGSVSKKSTVLIIGENVGAAKTNKARELGTKVITEQVAREMLGE